MFCLYYFIRQQPLPITERRHNLAKYVTAGRFKQKFEAKTDPDHYLVEIHALLRIMAEVKEQMSAEDIVVAEAEMLKNDDKNSNNEYLGLLSSQSVVLMACV